MDAQHAAKSMHYALVGRGESQFKHRFGVDSTRPEQQHQAKRLDLVLGTGTKIQEMTMHSNKSNLQVHVFCSDFGGFSQIRVRCLS